MTLQFPYPRASNWVLHRRNRDGTYTLKDCLHGGRYTLGATIGQLWSRLDGQTDPAHILPQCSRQKVSAMIDALEKEKLVRRSRILERSTGSITCSLIIPRHHSRRSLLPVILNRLLLVLWLPVLITGIYSFLHNTFPVNTICIPLGQVVGLLAGLIGHEAGHAVAALAYGAPVLEGGVLVQHWLPGAYVLLDDSPVKSRLRKAQIHAAGAEMNLLIAGVALILAQVVPGAYGFCFGVAINNLLLGLVNLVFIDSLDGMHVLEVLLGFQPLKVIRSKPHRRALKQEGLPGLLELAVCCILKALQLSYPVLLALNILEVILWIIYSVSS